MREALHIQDEQLKGCDCGKDGDTGAPGMWGTVRGQWHLNTTWCVHKNHIEAHPGVHVPRLHLSWADDLGGANVRGLHPAPLVVLQQIGLEEDHRPLWPLGSPELLLWERCVEHDIVHALPRALPFWYDLRPVGHQQTSDIHIKWCTVW